MGRRSGLRINGLLVLDKPAGLTSFAAVQAVRRVLRAEKAGHTGTLDPLATGVLPVCLGQATKIAGLLQAEDKEYTGTALCGVETDTLDVTGRRLAEHEPAGVTAALLQRHLGELEGAQLQAPPAYSAVHSHGVRAYELARRGEEVELAPREIVVRRFRFVGWEPPRCHFLVECSKGTYVRSLVAELGRRLGCGAALEALRRTRSGAFTLRHAVTLEALAARPADLPLPLVGLDEALAHLPAVELPAAAAAELRQGRPVPGGVMAPGGATAAELVRVRCGGELLGLGAVHDGQVWPKRLLVD